MTFADHRKETYGPFRPFVSLLTLLSVIALPLSGFEPACAQVANVVVTGTTSNPLLGNYRGTLTGAISGLGISAQDIVAAVDQTGKITISVPGLGTGTVTPNGQCRATARFVLNRNNLTVSFVGAFVVVKSPSTGKINSVVGVGTWRVTTPGVVGGGKWIIRQAI
ncbi:MAG: hypothetical protein U0936_08340 [Planctomycetaceae bacterium]